MLPSTFPSIVFFSLVLCTIFSMALVRETPIPSYLCTRNDLFPICGLFRATDNSGVSFALPSDAGEFTVGRDLDCSLPFVGTTLISRLHCKMTNSIVPGGASYLISVTDTSKNGTFINGAKLPSNLPHAIANGSRLKFGGQEGPEFMLEQYHPLSIPAQYLIGDKQLGRGGFGTVVAAHNRKTGVPVAIKIIRIERDRRSPEREKQRLDAIRREVSLMRHIDHPNIVKMETAVIQGDSVYIAMELAPHGTLADVIRNRNEIIHEEDARIVASQLCTALRFLHEMGIIHRDVKPANILIYSYDPAIIKVSDLGLATIQESHYAHTLCGTPLYMAPEVCVRNDRFRRYDCKADSWAVGVTLWYMLARKHPWTSKDLNIAKGIDKRYVSFYSLPHDWSFDMRKVVEGLCMRDPRLRMSMSDTLNHRWLNSSA